ncbi:hypothetical protein [Aureimonas sp. AU4]|uniref:hypothetical protein n=1 Tax=Aureimonas sp. AU4 TaxID=1638163 RepID=UPI000A6D6D18|nr:hypothetical protein [Aureimonas sp. AU4]
MLVAKQFGEVGIHGTATPLIIAGVPVRPDVSSHVQTEFYQTTMEATERQQMPGANVFAHNLSFQPRHDAAIGKFSNEQRAFV